MSTRYKQSEALLKRALKLIPLGTGTFSKSYKTYQLGISPLYANRAKGSKIWDVDGNEYIDYVGALCPVILGYCDPEVDNAVKEQISKGTLFSLAHELEIEVAKKIIDMVPCAEMVRFGKNGSDATTGAVRLARAYTGRKYIAKCKGHYHGWLDWSICTTNDLGIPQETKDLTLQFEYNNIASLEKLFKDYGGQIACIIMEPMNTTWPENNFLHKCQKIAKKNGALFILDEVITALRFGNGGAQEYFKIKPDLCCLGKSLGNGYPISAIAGKKEIMKMLEEIHFSFTFASDLVGLAAANVVLDKFKKEPIYNNMLKKGLALNYLLPEYDHVYISGHLNWLHMNFSSFEIKALFMQEAYKNGILTNGTFNLSAAHTSEDIIEKTIYAYTTTNNMIEKSIKDGTIKERLKIKPLESKFKVR